MDATVQEYAYYAYFGHWVRDALYQIFVAHGPVSTWSPFWGYGDDLYTSYLPYLLSPFSLTAILFSAENAEAAYNAVIVLRLYAAGLAFILYARLRNIGRPECLLGAVCYVFAGTSVVMFLHPSFLDNLVIFPLLLSGVELLLAGRNPLLFVYALCLACRSPQSALPFCVFLLVYIVYRIVFAPDSLPRKDRARAVRRLVGYAALSMGLQMVFLAPLFLDTMLGMDRLQVERDVPLAYSGQTYISLYLGLVGREVLNADGYWGFGPLFLCALVLLCLRWREHKALTLLVAAVVLLVGVPFFSSALNAFQYPNVRWFWMPAFVGAWATMRMLGCFGGLRAAEAKVLVTVCALYGIVALLLPGGEATASFWIAYGCSLVVVGALVASTARLIDATRTFALLVAVAAFGGAVNLATYVSPAYDGNISGLNDAGGAYADMAYGSTAALDRLNEDYHGLQLEEGDLWRYDDAVDHANNANLFNERLGIDFYSSLYSNDVDQFHSDLALNNPSAVYYLGLNGRSSLEALLGVRYFIAPRDDEGTIVPFQFDEVSYRYFNWDVLTTRQSLALAFVQNGMLTRSQWDSLSPIERQSCLMGSVVVEDADLPVLAQSGLAPVSLDPVGAMASLGAPVKVPYEVTSAVDVPTPEDAERAARTGKKLEYPQRLAAGEASGYVVRAEDGQGFVVRSGSSRVHLDFDAPANSEVYVVFENLRFTPFSRLDTYTDEEWENASALVRGSVLWDSATSETTQRASVWARGIDRSAWSQGQVYTTDYFMYAGHHDFALNLGVSEEPLTGAVLEFSAAGVYTYDSMTVWAQPMDRFDSAVEELQRQQASDLHYGNGVISGNIDMEEDGLLFLSVSYSDGWSCTVDGQPADVLKADVAFMAVPMAAGSHSFELRYTTPYAFEGAIVSGISLAVLIALLIRRRSCRR